MATIKSFTDIEQSRKLAEILPLESADMYYSPSAINTEGQVLSYNPFPKCIETIQFNDGKEIFALSLSALLSAASTYCSRLETTLRADKNYNIFAVSGDFVFRSFDDFPNGFDNLVDACYEVIIKLYEVKLI